MRSFFLALIVLIEIVSSKIFEKCELAHLLENKYGYSRDEVKKWVCIAQYESTFNTAAINHYNWDGSKDYGLFQLNDRYWCGSNSGKNVCNIPCSALLDDDLTDDIKCANKIAKDTASWMGVKDGLVAWVAYKNRCVDRNLDEYMAACWSSAVSSETPTIEQSLSENIIPKEPSAELSDNAPSQALITGPRIFPILPITPSQLKVPAVKMDKVVDEVVPPAAVVKSDFIMIDIKPSDLSSNSDKDIIGEDYANVGDAADVVMKMDVKL